MFQIQVPGPGAGKGLNPEGLNFGSFVLWNVMFCYEHLKANQREDSARNSIYIPFNKLVISSEMPKMLKLVKRYWNIWDTSKRMLLVRGRLHGELSTPGLKSALLTGLKFFAITWTISTPGLKRYTIRSRHRFAEVKKAFILFSCNK
jgi:hypothetical protein